MSILLGNFIAINMAQELPLALMFFLGVFFIQAGLKRFSLRFKIHPFILFVCYWFLRKSEFEQEKKQEAQKYIALNIPALAGKNVTHKPNIRSDSKGSV